MPPRLPDEDEDSISLYSSTWTEEKSNYGEGKDYIVDKILAQRVTEEDGMLEYLIQWEGYGVERATWEPADGIPEEYVLLWHEKQLRVKQTIDQPFDVEAWLDNVERVKAGKSERKKRRVAKQKRLGMLPSESSDALFVTHSDERADGAGKEDSDDDIPLSRRKKQKLDGHPHLGGFVVAESEDEDDVPLATLQRNMSRQSANRPLREEAALSDDSLMEELRTSSVKDKRRKRNRSNTPPPKPKERPAKKFAPSPTLAKKLPQTALSNAPSTAAKTGQATTTTRTPPKQTPTTTSPENLQQNNTPTTPAAQTSDLSTDMAGRRVKDGEHIFSNWDKPLPVTNRRTAPPRRRTADNHEPSRPALPKTHTELTRFHNARVNEKPPPGGAENHETFDPETGAFRPALMPLDLTTEAATTSNQRNEPRWPWSRADVPEQTLPIPERLDLTTDDKVPLTCPAWRSEGKCRDHEDNECSFLHEDTPYTASFNLKAQAHRGDSLKVSLPGGRRTFTCAFWYYGKGCYKSVDECDGAHWNTGLLMAGLMAPSQRIFFERDSAHVPRDPFTGGFKANKTCFFWAVGICQTHKNIRGCKMPEDQCQFYHVVCDEIAEPPLSCRPWGGEMPTLGKVRARLEESATSTNPDKEHDVDDSRRTPDALKPSEERMLRNMFSPENVARAKNRPVTKPFVADMKIFGQLQAIPVEFGGLNEEARSLLLAAYGEQPKLDVKLVCTAGNFRVFWEEGNATNLLSSGTIKPNDPASSEALEVYSDSLKINDSGALILHSDFAILLFPSRQDRWAYLKPKNDPIHALQFYIRAPLKTSIVRGLSAGNISMRSDKGKMASVLHTVYGIDDVGFKRLLEWPNAPLAPRFFLMFDSEAHAAELKLLTRMLQDKGAKVYHMGVKGSWKSWQALFRNDQRGGVVITHPTLRKHYTIPELSYFLNSKCNFFTFGSINNDEFLKEDGWVYQTENQFIFKKIFPGGSIVFITDEVFAHYPKDALTVVKHVAEKNKGKEWGKKTWILAGRPDLQLWLADLRDGKINGFPKDDKHVTRNEITWHVYHKFNPSETWRVENVPRPGDNAALLSLDSHDMPDYEGLENPYAATERIIEWFHRHAYYSRRTIRRSVVIVHEVTEQHMALKKQWMELDFLTADKYMKRFK
ncbi:hypothetical protein NA57DRAFT_81869 [Rhizodiscina lignyota]|uniref:Chromo domain-containing protein n=1 Tax=Rhizodiscina lignyota TaxID=1504668 RepID=A0A9P4M121_9PEZI|nr:hypothetical protein NA57DRAFT_81869 [Rhizodiscina lignyota]